MRGLLLRATAALLLGLLFSVTAVPTAAAHVSLDRFEPVGDGTTRLVFTFDHGCETQPTVGLDVSAPEGTVFVDGATGQPDGWTPQVHDGSVSWSGTPIPTDQAAEFSVVARITGQVGQELRFPAVQHCEGGLHHDWTDREPGADYPAPTLVATAAVLAPAPGPAGDSTQRGTVILWITGFVVAAAAAGALTGGRVDPGARRSA